ncbi:BTB/POZ domain-containing protein NPY1-like isoform X1 [Zingiber officinale]|uniref:BTB/POZ domain-containing protein NPY1-like isoform X1 n=1 Tax=Zingiber officinale TaxID=94328 RepID=UPI001C4A8453|nr:BTB/POZ domain-containing protein NPY1-like isoform X1 [Zingiber officinale]
MKFMKLGSKPDAFRSEGRCIRFVMSELPTDIIVHVDEVRFYLHKFPLLAKCNRLQQLVLEVVEDRSDEIILHDFPGGPDTFELCAKFCYGITVTLNAHNVVAARCAAEYLEMDDGVEKGNLVHKLEVFLNTSVLQSWKDSIIVFQMTKSSLPWSEELKIARRCIECIASKTLVDSKNVNWPYTYSRKQGMHRVPSDWWVEDLCELDADLYKRVMVVVKSKGKLSSDTIREALKAYAARWLPDSHEALINDNEHTKKNTIVVETIISLLPPDECSVCSCRFLLKLLKVVILVGARDALREELIDRISIQLHKASVKSLLIPSKSGGGIIMYDVDLVQSLVDKFTTHIGSSFVDENGNSEALVALGKLIDCYLSEVANDLNLSISRFTKLAQSIPASARSVHDGLYTAIDIYLKEHPNLTKAEKKRICNLMDVKKLSSEACVHAVQNEQLPLRTVVQVLFLEQWKASGRSVQAPSVDALASRTTVEEEWDGRPVSNRHCSLKQQLGSLKINVDECRGGNDKRSKSMSEKGSSSLLLPSRSRRLFDKLWAVKVETVKSSETSGSSRSPTVCVKRREAKSCRHVRYSIS